MISVDDDRSAPIALIVAPQNDAHALMVAHVLREQFNCPTTIFSMAAFPVGTKACFECGENTKIAADVGGLDLTQVKVVWWRRPEHSSVPSEYFVFDREFLQVECDHFLQGLLWSNSCRWVNHPTNEIRASRKLFQLAQAAKIGLNVPRTIITNSPERAQQFVKSVGKALITKRIGTTPGSATKTSLLTHDDLNRLHTIETCPTTLQEYIEPGGDLRVVVVGSVLFAFWIDSAKSVDPVDSRLDLTVEHRAYDLPVEQKEMLFQLLNQIGLVFGVIDLRVSPTGRYYFLEINPSGQFAYLELLTRVPLSSHVAGLLASSVTDNNHGESFDS